MALTLTPAFAADPAARPPVPIGVDPGGVLIAIIGDGVDYTQPDIAARLARDGEGELIGWDLIDNDRRPYGDKGSLQTATVRVVLGEPGTARVAIFRVDALPPAIRAVAMAAQAKARVMMLPSLGPAASGLTVAMSAFPGIIFVVPPVLDLSMGRAETRETQFPMPANMLSVANDARCDQSVTVPADVSTDGGCFGIIQPDKPVFNVPAGELAAARIAALAARIMAAGSNLTGAEVKQRILALAIPSARHVPGAAAPLRLEDPSRPVPP